MKMVGLGDFSFYNSFYRELSILQITTSYLCSNNFEKNRLQNCLMVSNIQLSSVVSDTFGKSAQAILDKILENRADTSFDLEPLEGPFYGIEIALGILNSQGGARRNGLCEVLNTEGQPIPRLYSAGEFGSIYSYMYNGGGNISEAVATGRVAGQQAASLDSWE